MSKAGPTPASLREKAARYRQIAKGLYNRELEAKLEALARDYERRAAALEARKSGR
jgi:hypothetical protein